MWRIAFVAASVALGACASTQLNYNTLDVASSVGDVYMRQVLTNLSRTIDDHHALPSQVVLSAGTIQTANSLTPSLNTPFSHSVTRTGAGAISSTTLAGTAFTFNASDSWQQNWNVSPVGDGFSMRNLQALYRHAVLGTNLASEYTTPWTISSTGTPKPDTFYLQQPHCVKCEGNKINDKLQPTQWLYWINDPQSPAAANPPPADVPIIDLGHFGNHELFMTAKDFDAGVLADFALFVLPVVEPNEAGKGKGVTAAVPLGIAPLQ